MHIDTARKTAGILAIFAFILGILLVELIYDQPRIVFGIFVILASITQVYMVVACFASCIRQKVLQCSSIAIIIIYVLDVAYLAWSIWWTIMMFYVGPTVDGFKYTDLILPTFLWISAPSLQLAATIYFKKFAKMYRGAQAGYIRAPEGVQE